jgi:hypothetical protein
MTGRYLVELADVLRAAGVHVVEVDGWQTRARKSGGYAGNRPWCVMWHHTASQATPDQDIAYIIGADTAPISNLYLDRTGCVHVIAAGATNTNGKGGPQQFSRGIVPLDCMNEYAVSIEAANSGLGEQWPQVQVDAFFQASIALTNWLGLEPTDISSHAGWTTRKIDPATAAAVQGPWRPASVNSSGTWSLEDLRHEAARRAATAPTPPTPTPPTPTPPKDTDMPIAFVAAAPNNATVLVAIDGAGTSVLAFATEEDRATITEAAGNPPTIHISEAQMGEIMARAGQGAES